MDMQSINPSTNKSLGAVKTSTPEEIKHAVLKARQALASWKAVGVKGRVAYIEKAIENLEKMADELAITASTEMGMPITQSRNDVAGGIEYMRWYVENAETYLAPELVYEDDRQIHEVHHEPTGVVAAITPWNFPVSNFVWMVGQNLLVGNTVVFKHSEEVPLSGKLIEKAFNQADLPEGVLTQIYGDGGVGDLLVHENIDMICFTGSTATGQYLYKIGAQKFIRVFLELGGSAAGIVFEDAQIDEVIDTIYANRFDNCGQICDGLKRLIVHESKYEEVVAKLKTKLEDAVIGDALSEKTTIGPLVSQRQKDILNQQVTSSLDSGAQIIYQKEVPAKLSGSFYPPTLLGNIKPDMAVWKQEVFGPVLPIVTFKTEAEAVALANDTIYGLGGYIFTADKSRFEKVASLLETGMVQMNTAGYVQPPTPFGGCKASGIGREHGKFGFWELSTIKVVAKQK